MDSQDRDQGSQPRSRHADRDRHEHRRDRHGDSYKEKRRHRDTEDLDTAARHNDRYIVHLTHRFLSAAKFIGLQPWTRHSTLCFLNLPDTHQSDVIEWLILLDWLEAEKVILPYAGADSASYCIFILVSCRYRLTWYVQSENTTIEYGHIYTYRWFVTSQKQESSAAQSWGAPKNKRAGKFSRSREACKARLPSDWQG